MNQRLSQYYRCPDTYVRFAPKAAFANANGYFRFGKGAICYGACCGFQNARSPEGSLHDALLDVEIKNGQIYLPFDPSEVAGNLQCETYVHDWRQTKFVAGLARLYYFLRPILPVRVRRHLQKIHFRGWDKLPFPCWPVDSSIDSLMEQLLLLCLKANGVPRIPFIWFWPDGASSAAIMTHDVETQLGRDFCARLMDIDDSFGIKASFQIIPEERYEVSPQFLEAIRTRGFEVVVHDLNHDGHLYSDKKEFLKRAAKINAYGRSYAADGFRAGVLYRKQLWFDALDFSYDMSVPNVAHLDPQRGGCCTVMPYFLGKILEIPVTTTQDYTLFHILNDYSIDLWKRQIAMIMEKHGLISFVIHPDYILEQRERQVYEALLEHLASLRQETDVWIATPGEVNRWWRDRAQLKLVENCGEWRIEGPGKERARVAYFSAEQDRPLFTVSAQSDYEVSQVTPRS